jgi:hypothetical protein
VRAIQRGADRARRGWGGRRVEVDDALERRELRSKTREIDAESLQVEWPQAIADKGGHTYAAPSLSEDLVARRRVALAGIFGSVATRVVDRVVTEAVRASTFFGLTGELAERYGRSIRATFPVALDALTETDPAVRDQKLGDLVTNVRAVSDAHHVPRIIERGLVTIAFGTARSMIQARAKESGFTADELDSEFVTFRNEFERRLYES